MLKNTDGATPKPGRPFPMFWWMEGNVDLTTSKEEGIVITVKGPWKASQARLTQQVVVEPQTDYRLTVQMKGTVETMGFVYIEFMEPNGGGKPGFRELKSQARIKSEKCGTQWQEVTLEVPAGACKILDVGFAWEQSDRVAGQRLMIRNPRFVKVGPTAERPASPATTQASVKQ
jgi:hypothetical protein